MNLGQNISPDFFSRKQLGCLPLEMTFLRIFLPSLLFFSFCKIQAQSKIEWSEEYTLQASDFKAPAPNTGTQQTIYPSTFIEYQFANYQVMFGNTNKVVSCSFQPLSSWLDDGPATEMLLRYAQATFDLSELSARKLRKKFHENRMTLNATKAEMYYSEVSEEMTALISRYAKETDFGNIQEKQDEWEAYLQELLAEYANFCKGCKPPKKKKKKKKKKK